jgi:hypothetical protein
VAQAHEIKARDGIALHELEQEQGDHAGQPRDLQETPAAEELNNQPCARGQQEQRPRNHDAIVKHRDISDGFRKCLDFPKLTRPQVSEPHADEAAADQDGADDVRELEERVSHDSEGVSVQEYRRHMVAFRSEHRNAVDSDAKFPDRVSDICRHA